MAKRIYVKERVATQLKHLSEPGESMNDALTRLLELSDEVQEWERPKPGKGKHYCPECDTICGVRKQVCDNCGHVFGKNGRLVFLHADGQTESLRKMQEQVLPIVPDVPRSERLFSGRPCPQCPTYEGLSRGGASCSQPGDEVKKYTYDDNGNVTASTAAEAIREHNLPKRSRFRQRFEKIGGKRVLSARIRCEQLEDRRLLSAAVPHSDLNSGNVLYEAASGDVFYLDFDGEEDVEYNGPVVVADIDPPYNTLGTPPTTEEMKIEFDFHNVRTTVFVSSFVDPRFVHSCSSEDC